MALSTHSTSIDETFSEISPTGTTSFSGTCRVSFHGLLLTSACLFVGLSMHGLMAYPCDEDSFFLCIPFSSSYQPLLCLQHVSKGMGMRRGRS